MNHLDPIGVNHFKVPSTFLRWNDFYRTCIIGIHGPLSNIEVMSTHVRQSTIAVFAVSSPCREVVMDIIWAKNFVISTSGGGSLPCIPVDSIRDGLSGKVTGDRRITHTDTNFLQFPNRSTPDHFYSAAKFSSVLCPLLAASLENNFIFFNRLCHGTTFFNR